MNLYVRPADLRAELQITSSTPTDAVLEGLLDQVSRYFDAQTGRRFYAETATAYYDGSGTPELRLARFAVEPWRGDLIAATSVKVDTTDNGTYDTTLTEDTDFWLDPRVSADVPARRLVIPATRAVAEAVWPRGRRLVEVVGRFGYSEETAAAGTLDGAITDAAAVTITMADAHGVRLGDTILVGTEQMYVSAQNTDTLTVTRGVNGTTAATHLDAAAVARRVYPGPLVQGVKLEAVRLYRELATGYGGAVTSMSDGGGSGFRASWPAIKQSLDTYRVPVVR